MASFAGRKKVNKRIKVSDLPRIDTSHKSNTNGAKRTIALKHLKRVDPYFYRATKAHHSSLPMELSKKRTRAELFAALISIVISQQLGRATADTIFARVKKACYGRLSPKSILKVRPAIFRTAGLSGAKTRTLKEIAAAIEKDSLDLLSLQMISDADAAKKLLHIWGLGQWSVEMFFMNALGRGDIFSPGDLGLVRAMEAIYNLPKNTPRTSLLAIAEKWSPHRTYASLLLWHTKDTKAG